MRPVLQLLQINRMVALVRSTFEESNVANRNKIDQADWRIIICTDSVEYNKDECI